jgi:uncharacterized membrane protein YkvA (DUF1232 family)
MDGLETDTRSQPEPAVPGEPVAAAGETKSLVPLAPAEAPLARFWEAVRRLPRYLKLAANLARDPNVSKRVKALVGAGGAYAISPIDLVPGIIPVAGQIDDVLVLLLALRAAIRLCPEELAAAHLERAGLQLSDFGRDIAATKDAAIWVAKRGARASGKLAMRGARRAGTLTQTAVRAARKANAARRRPGEGHAL